MADRIFAWGKKEMRKPAKCILGTPRRIRRVLGRTRSRWKHNIRIIENALGHGDVN
jgi:hypothetical protein